MKIFTVCNVCSIREILGQYIKWLFQSNSSLRLYFVPSSRQIYSPVLSWGSSAGWNKNKIERFILWLHFFEFLEFWRFEMWNVFNRLILTQSKCPEGIELNIRKLLLMMRRVTTVSIWREKYFDVQNRIWAQILQILLCNKRGKYWNIWKCTKNIFLDTRKYDSQIWLQLLGEKY